MDGPEATPRNGCRNGGCRIGIRGAALDVVARDAVLDTIPAHRTDVQHGQGHRGEGHVPFASEP
ncbi:hypothetical protein ACFWHQ_02175 [Streptomyces sp. NPDC060334]|uniref:hypothetical protein n=1 Tax=unclassified Streptomyces TaxID=2593676 RepID=UPI003646DF18